MVILVHDTIDRDCIFTARFLELRDDHRVSTLVVSMRVRPFNVVVEKRSRRLSRLVADVTSMEGLAALAVREGCGLTKEVSAVAMRGRGRVGLAVWMCT